MTDERDLELGGALRSLPTPDHDPAFWDDLAERLEGARCNRLQRALGGRVGTWGRPLLAVAAAVAVVMAATAVIRQQDYQDNTRVVTAPTLRESGSVRSVQGVLVTRDPAPVGERHWRFAVAADGRYRLSGIGFSEEEVYNAAHGTMTSFSEPDGGEARSRATSEVAPGPPDDYAPGTTRLLRLDLGWVVRALALAGDPAVRDVEVDGRPAWRYETALPLTDSAESADHLVAVVDRRTLLPLAVTETLRGELFHEQQVVDLIVDGELAAEEFLHRVAAHGASESAGFRRTTLEHVADAAGFPPLVPGQLPEGFGLAEVAVAGPPRMGTGAEAHNPVAGPVVSLSYRRGIEQVTLTVRPAGDDPSRWSDPFGVEGVELRGERVHLDAGALAGAEAEVVVDPRSVPHLWAVHGGIVVTLAGSLSPSELVAAARSLERWP